jgi:hypothetical protein
MYTEVAMTEEEWDLLIAIRREMNDSLMAQDTATQEKYVELLVKSLQGKGDLHPAHKHPK